MTLSFKTSTTSKKEVLRFLKMGAVIRNKLWSNRDYNFIWLGGRTRVIMKPTLDGNKVVGYKYLSHARTSGGWSNNCGEWEIIGFQLGAQRGET